MCKFLSALVMPTGDVKCNPMIDSHSDLVSLFDINDTAAPGVVQRFAKVEFTPPDDSAEFCNLDKWTLTVDEPTEPDWWIGVKDQALSTLHAIVERMIVRDHRRILVGGCWAIADGGRIDHLVQGRIVHVGRYADLSRTNLSGADLSRANLSHANLSRANLSGANLSGAYRPKDPPAGWAANGDGYLVRATGGDA